MADFNFKSLDENIKAPSVKYMPRGVNQVTILDVEWNEPEGKSPYFLVKTTFEGLETPHTQKFYFSEKTMARSVEKMAYVIAATFTTNVTAGFKTVLSQIKEQTNSDDLLAYLKKNLAGKQVKIKFTGQKDNSSGKIWTNWHKWSNDMVEHIDSNKLKYNPEKDDDQDDPMPVEEFVSDEATTVDWETA